VRKAILSIVLALMLLVVFAVPIFAASSQDVTVTATPSFIAISNAPATWTINDLGTGTENGKGRILPNTTYYANPVDGDHDTTAPSSTVLDAECNFTITNTSTVAIDITVTWGDFTGGGADMTNSNAGTNGATTYGAYSWFSGDSYASKVIIQDTGSAVGKNALAATTDIKWGAEILTRTDAWTSGTSSATTAGEHLTITATQD